MERASSSSEETARAVAGAIFDKVAFNHKNRFVSMGMAMGGDACAGRHLGHDRHATALNGSLKGFHRHPFKV